MIAALVSMAEENKSVRGETPSTAPDIVLETLVNSADISLTEIAARRGYSERQVQRKIRAQYGKTWGNPITMEDDAQRAFCYPAVFFTKDNAMLCGYCRSSAADEDICLQRLGIMKIGLDEI